MMTRVNIKGIFRRLYDPRWLIVAVVSMQWVAVPNAVATTFTWAKSGGGAYGLSDNWSPNTDKTKGPPRGNDLAILGLNGTVTGGGTAAAFEISGGDVIFSGSYTASPPSDSLGLLINSGTLDLGSGASLDSGGPATIGTAGGELNLHDGANVFISSGGSATAAAINIGAGGSGTVKIDGSGTTLTTDDEINVGLSGNGAMNITNGGYLSSQETANGASVQLGVGAGTAGTLSINGKGSTYDTNGQLNIGGGGTGKLTVSGQGTLNTGDTTGADPGIVLGFGKAANGTLNVEGSGSSVNSKEQVEIGREGTGNVTVSNQASMVANDQAGYPATFIGNGSSSNGTLTVKGDGTTYKNIGTFVIGSAGKGTLKIQDKGKVTDSKSLLVGDTGTGTVDISGGGYLSTHDDTATNSPSGGLGASAGGLGTINISGKGSTYDTNGQLNIGGDGTGKVTVSDQGTLNTGDTTGINPGIVLGFGKTGDGTLKVDGSGSSVNSKAQVEIGREGTGKVTVSNQATMVADEQGGAPATFIANTEDSTGTLTVTDNGSTYTSKGKLIVGNAGTGTLTVDNNGLATVEDDAVFGSEETGIGLGYVKNGGSFEVQKDLTLGESGLGDVQVSNEGELKVSGDLTLGEQSNGAGALDVSGAGSTAGIDGDVTVGEQGTGLFSLSDSGQATVDGDLVVGKEKGSLGGVSLSDTGTTIDYSGGDISVGKAGDGTFAVAKSAAFDTTQKVTLGEEATGTGTLNVTGSGSEFSSDALTAGEKGTGKINVDTFGYLNTDSEGSLGEGANTTGTASVTNGGYWQVGKLTVGSAGKGELDVNSGGIVNTGDTTSLGEKAGSKGIASITGGDLYVGSGLTVGGGGNGDLTIGAYGYVSAGGSELAIGEQSTGSGTLSLDGPGATLDYYGEVVAGKEGSGAFAVQDGASETLYGSLKAATEAGSTGAVAVDGVGSNLTVYGEFTIGEQSKGILTVKDGGSLETAGDASIGEKPGASGSSGTVEAGALTVDGKLTVAAQSIADLTVDGAGQLAATALTVGEHDGAQGTLTVGSANTPDPNTKIQILKDAEIGAEGTGTVTQNDGTVTVKGDLSLGGSADNPDATTGQGTYNLNGGTLNADSLTVGLSSTGTVTQNDGTATVKGDLSLGGSADNPDVTTGQGTYNLNGGTLNADSLTVGRSGVGTFNLNGGTLNDALVVGDSGAGQFNNTGGVHNVAGDLTLGNTATGDGTYLLNNPTNPGSDSLATSNDAIIGNAGQGTFEHLSGQATIGNDLVLGQTSTGVGSYTLSGSNSVLNVTQDGVIGDAGQGSFLQTGGTASVGNDLFIGNSSSAGNSYQLDAGQLQVGDVGYVGVDGTGTFTQTGGSVDAGYLDVGIYSGTGTYNMSGGTATAEYDLVVGATGKNDAEFHQTGGTVNVNSKLFGMYVNGKYDQSGNSTLNVVHDQVIGDTADGTFTQNDSTTTNTVGNDLILGNSSGATGTYHLKAGRLKVSGDAHVGENGTGVVDQTGGSATVSGTVEMAAGTGSIGSYNLSGGSLSAHGMEVHQQGAFNDSGGSVSLAGGSGTLQNDSGGKVTLSGSGVRTIQGNVTNAGTISTQHTSVVYTGSYTNNGAYESTASTNTFNDLVVAQDGYLTGGSNDSFIVGGALHSSSTQNVLWNTIDSTLEFTGTSTHQFSITSLDLGGHANGFSNNFAWGDIILGNGAGLNLLDGNTGNGSTALYTELLQLDGGIGQLSSIRSPFNIYYDPSLSGNAYLKDLSYALSGGGSLTPIGGQGPPSPTPEPSTLVLLATGIIALLLARYRWSHAAAVRR